MNLDIINSLFARLRSLVATLPDGQAEEIAQIFAEFTRESCVLAVNQMTMIQLLTQELSPLRQQVQAQERELQMWRKAERDWWESRVSRDTALFEDRLEMRQPELTQGTWERLS